MADDGDIEEGGDLNLFKEPEGYYEPEKQHTIATHTTLAGQTMNLRLVGHNPLWGHYLWNAGRKVSTYLERNSTSLVKNKTILELGAGAGLPSLICALNGAEQVVVTDYPDADLIENLKHNIDACSSLPNPKNIVAEGYLWGGPIEKLTAHLPQHNRDAGFDLLVLADLLFNHSEHAKLISTIQQCVKKANTSQVLVFFTPYRPWLLEKDMAFFELAREAGFEVEKTFEEVMDEVMFENDPGDEKLRRTVFGYRLTHRNALNDVEHP